MITITRKADGVTIEGHAGYAENGKDIVCAGVSALTQTLIYSIEKLTKTKIRWDSKPGWVEIEHGGLTADAKLLIDSFFIGIREIIDEYPDRVQIK